jgi:hypothetical protein
MRFPPPPTPSKPDLTLYARSATMRDYFAAKAMQAFVSLDHMVYERVAEEAYQVADAILKARES